MATTYDTWGWITSAIPNLGPNDLDSSVDGSVFDVGTDADYYTYGTLQMLDGNDDGLISDSDADDGSFAGSDRFIVGGTEIAVNEVAWYPDTTFTYIDPQDNTVKTWTVTAVLWQLNNGDTVIRITESDLANAPANFFVENVTSIELGTWNGVEYTSGRVDNFDAEPAVACFTKGTRIKTLLGEVMIEDLQVGDLVLTMDSGFRPIRWIGSNELSALFLRQFTKLRPIRISAGALGRNFPETDLLVSPQHRILVRSQLAERIFKDNEVLVAAKKLLGLDGISVVEDDAPVVYFHFLLDNHQIIWSNGAPTECLFTGPEAIKSVSGAAREEIFAIFPELKHGDLAGRPPARRIASGLPGRRFVERIKKNSKALVE